MRLKLTNIFSEATRPNFKQDWLQVWGDFEKGKGSKYSKVQYSLEVNGKIKKVMPDGEKQTLTEETMAVWTTSRLKTCT